GHNRFLRARGRHTDDAIDSVRVKLELIRPTVSSLRDGHRGCAVVGVNETTTAIDAAPVISDGVGYVASATGDAAMDATDHRRRLRPGYSITATPALAGGTLYVPTQWNDLVALDAANGIAGDTRRPVAVGGSALSLPIATRLSRRDESIYVS